MSQPTTTPSAIDRARGQVCDWTPESVVEAIATQIERLDESRRRINEEGIVVRDMKGSVIPHPAIKIEQDTIKLLDDLLSKHKKI